MQLEEFIRDICDGLNETEPQQIDFHFCPGRKCEPARLIAIVVGNEVHIWKQKVVSRKYSSGSSGWRCDRELVSSKSFDSNAEAVQNAQLMAVEHEVHCYATA